MVVCKTTVNNAPQEFRLFEPTCCCPCLEFRDLVFREKSTVAFHGDMYSRVLAVLQEE